MVRVTVKRVDIQKVKQYIYQFSRKWYFWLKTQQTNQESGILERSVHWLPVLDWKHSVSSEGLCFHSCLCVYEYFHSQSKKNELIKPPGFYWPALWSAGTQDKREVPKSFLWSLTIIFMWFLSYITYINAETCSHCRHKPPSRIYTSQPLTVS